MHPNPTSRRPIFFFLAATIGCVIGTGAKALAQQPDEARAVFAAPELLYSTTFGGGNSEGRDIAIDGDGNTIIAGTTSERFNFPLVNAADDDAGTQGSEGYVAKINAAGDGLIFSTYLGGQGDDWITDIDVDDLGNVYIVGATTASDFPTTAGTVQPSPGGVTDGFVKDAFVTKLDPLGNLLWSTYLGGNATDEAHGVKVASDRTVHVVGAAKSEGFPTANAYQGSCNKGSFSICDDAFVARLAANGKSILFSTFFGSGSTVESACSVDVDADGNLFVVGHHASDKFPFLNPFQDTYEGGLDMFVSKFAGDGELLWSSGLGGSNNDGMCAAAYRGPTIALDANGDAFVATVADSPDLPTPGGFQASNAGTTDGYLAKITSAGMIAWATYIGSENSDAITEVAVLPDGSPVVAGWSTSRDFPLTSDALAESDCPSSPTSFCSGDVFVAAIAADGSTLDFSTFLGGSDFDQANGIAIGSNGTIYIGGTTRTELWPLVDPLPPSQQGSGGTLTFVARIGDANTPIPGDANGDGAVTASDALAGLGAALGTGQCLPCVCDLNGDGNISATDALIILNMAVSIPVTINPPPC